MNKKESLPLIKSKLQLFYIVFFLLIIFSLNTIYEYNKFLKFKNDEVFITNSKVINIYNKKQHKILKLKANSFTFFTKTQSKQQLKINDKVNIFILTSKVSFLEYLKGFYTPSFNIEKIKNDKPTIKQYLIENVNSQHSNQTISSLFNALFFATPINKELREICSTFGVSHLVAISGFHLGIISGILYFLLYIPYSTVQQKYFPYRNKKFDLLLIVSTILFSYLIFTDIVPSLLRAFMMYIFAIFLLRSNIKIVSFLTLALIVLFIIAIFPKLLFSLSLWFSVAGVFYIFLFLQYFKNMNKILAFFLFNIWIYLAINPITHYFFGTTSLVQLYSPLFTIGFTIFYPVELFLHFIGFGGLLDSFIEIWLNLKTTSKEVFTPLWVLIGYIIISLFSIPCPKWFRTLNLSLIAFNIWLYVY